MTEKKSSSMVKSYIKFIAGKSSVLPGEIRTIVYIVIHRNSNINCTNHYAFHLFFETNLK